MKYQISFLLSSLVRYSILKGNFLVTFIFFPQQIFVVVGGENLLSLGTNLAGTNIEIFIRSEAKRFDGTRNQLIRAGIEQIQNLLKTSEENIRTIQNGFRLQAKQDGIKFQKLSKQFFNLGSSDEDDDYEDEDIEKCYDNFEYSFIDAINTALDTALLCSEDEIDEGIKYARKATENLQSSSIYNLNNEITKCSKSNARLSCFTRILIRLQGDAISIPVQIAKRITESKFFFDGIQTDVFQCAIDIAEDIAEEALEANRNIADCISGVNATTSTTESTTESTTASTTESTTTTTTTTVAP